MAFSKYLFEYWHQGKKWQFELYASSQADAFERLRKLDMATLLGTHVMDIPAQMGVFARAIVRLRNWAVGHRDSL